MSTDAPTSESHEDSHAPNYLKVFGVLCGLTVLSVLADAFKQEKIAFAIALVAFAIAIVKASYVMMYFMHLKFEGGWKYVILLPTLLLGLGLPLAMMPDLGVHYYTLDDTRAPAVIEHAHAGGDASHNHEEKKIEKKAKKNPFDIKPDLGTPQKKPPVPSQG